MKITSADHGQYSVSFHRKDEGPAVEEGKYLKLLYEVDAGLSPRHLLLWWFSHLAVKRGLRP